METMDTDCSKYGEGGATVTCDMEMVSCMSKEECAAYCDSMKCSPEEKELCLKHAGMTKDKKDCCKKEQKIK